MEGGRGGETGEKTSPVHVCKAQVHSMFCSVGDAVKMDDPEPLGILHSLYSMTFTSGLRDCVMGRRAIAHVLGLANNLNALLPFIQPSGNAALALQGSRYPQLGGGWGGGSNLVFYVLSASTVRAIWGWRGQGFLVTCQEQSSMGRLAHDPMARLCDLK